MNPRGKKGRCDCPSSSNGSREQTRALIPLKLALHELHPDQGGRAQRLGLARELDQAGVKRMFVNTFHAGIHNSQLPRAGRKGGKRAHVHLDGRWRCLFFVAHGFFDLGLASNIASVSAVHVVQDYQGLFEGLSADRNGAAKGMA